MRQFAAAAGLVVALGFAAFAQGQPEGALHLTFNDDGTVTLAAHKVTVRQILAEWAKLCSCYVVNADRLANTTLTVPVFFERAPQSAVLRSLLKQAGGYALTPRRPGTTGPSSYETIYILAAGTASQMPSYVFDRGPVAIQAVPMPTTGAPDDELPPITPIRAPEPVDPDKPMGGAPEARAPGTNPGMSIPGVRVVPISPVSPPPTSGSAPPAAPGGVTPARTP